MLAENKKCFKKLYELSSMEYVNSYLEKMALLLRKELKEEDVPDIVEEAKIEASFIRDAKEVVRRYESGEMSGVDAKKNLDLLKVYVVTQLQNHRKKAIELLELDAGEEIDGEVIKRIVEFIEDAQSRIE
jgi:hypothetical protein